MEHGFTVRAQATDGGATLTLSLAGELDIAASALLRRDVADALRRPPPLLVVDLTDVPFIDSTGLGALVDAHRRLEEAGSDMLITGAQPVVRRTFSLCGLDERLPLADDLVEGRPGALLHLAEAQAAE